MYNSSREGELNGYQFIMEAYGDNTVFRRPISCLIMILCFVRNAYRAICAMCKNPRKIAPWCCITMTVGGILSPSCSSGVLQILVGMTLYTMATNCILFERAYLAQQKSRWILAAGVLAVAIPGPAYAVAIWYLATPTISEFIGCHTTKHYMLPYIRIMLDLPAHIIFSVVFFLVLYKRYKTYREGCWKHLARDGVITMLLVIASNIICCLVNTIAIAKDVGDMFYIMDWLVASTLLVEYQYKISSSAYIKKTSANNIGFTPVEFANSVEGITRTKFTHLWSEFTIRK
ncbi:hypothetical protein BDF19DRAFT_453483 [Syncephalis fuscata]|nr:hypothetical protein BDF19DRAFT_453483 [Syncephalis fuscata]